MTKLNLFSLLIIIVVIHQFNAAKISSLVHVPETVNERISFVDMEEEKDEITKLKEKIKMEMDAYRKGMEKKKPTKTTTTTTPTTTTTEAPTSSTLVHVYLVGIDLFEGGDETTDSSLLSTTTINNRHIIDAPVLCREGERIAAGRCRKIYSRLSLNDDNALDEEFEETTTNSA